MGKPEFQLAWGTQKNFAHIYIGEILRGGAQNLPHISATYVIYRRGFVCAKLFPYTQGKFCAGVC